MGNNFNNLTPKELKFVEEVQAEMEFFDQYKELMKEVKKIFISQGPKAARAWVRTQSHRIVSIAADEMFHALMTKL